MPRAVIVVTALRKQKRLVPRGKKAGFAGWLAHDREIAAKRTVVHETVLGFNLATAAFMSRVEAVVPLNAPELPA